MYLQGKEKPKPTEYRPSPSSKVGSNSSQVEVVRPLIQEEHLHPCNPRGASKDEISRDKALRVMSKLMKLKEVWTWQSLKKFPHRG